MVVYLIQFLLLITSFALGEDLAELARKIVESPSSKARFERATCHDIEGDRSTCHWCQKAMAEQYPLDFEDFQRSFIEGNACLWKDLVRKLDANEVVYIAVLGGSMTVGHGCNDSPEGCPWSANLERLFNSSNVVVKNYAVPAANYDHFLASGDLQLIDCDLLLVDLAVNALTYFGDIERLQSRVDNVIYDVLSAHPKRPLLWVTTYLTAAGSGDLQECPHDKGEVLYSFLGRSISYSWCWFWLRIKDHEQRITSHYDIPVASYRDAAWRGTHKNGIMETFATAREDQVCLWNAWRHPSSLTHILVADVVYFSIHGMLNKARALLPESKDCTVVSTPLKAEVAAPRLCAEFGFTSHMTFNQPDGFKTTNSTSNWSFEEYQKGKPGWTIDLKESSFEENFISFSVEIGSAHIIETMYLQSFTKIGTVRAVLRKPDGEVAGSFEIKSWEEGSHASIVVTFQHVLSRSFSPGKYIVTYSLSDESHYPKFKIVGVSSC